MASTYPKNLEINPFFADTERLYRNLIESVRCGIYMADQEGTIFFVNQSCADMMGYPNKREMIGLNLNRDFYLSPRYRLQFLKDMEKTGFVRDYEVKLVRKDGVLVVLSVTSNFIRDSHEQVIGVQGMVQDITRRKDLEQNLSAERDKLEQLLAFGGKVSQVRVLDQLCEFIVERTTGILNAHKCSLLLLDKKKNVLIVQSAKGLKNEVVSQTRVSLGEGICGRVASNGEAVLVRNIEYDKRFVRKNGPSYESRSFMSVALKLNRKVLGVINVADNRDLTRPFDELDLKILVSLAAQSAVAIENAKMYQDLEYLSVTDPLTGLSNHRHFISLLDEEIRRFKRYGNSFCLLFIDVDGFKGYNDSFGHLEGDTFLKDLSRIFTAHTRDIDKVCRYGGDEFVVLLPNTTSEQALIVAEKVRSMVAQFVFRKPMSVSIGVSEYHEGLARVDLVQQGDQALLKAKAQGKDCVYLC